MKKSQNLLAFTFAIFAFLCMSVTDVNAQNYLGKDEAVINLINESVALTESLPGLEHNSDLYEKSKEKLRVVKKLAEYIKTGNSVADAVEFILPNQGRGI